MHNLKNIPWWAYIAFFKIAYIVLLAYFHPTAYLSVDAQGYLQLAENLWHQHTFSRNITSPYLFDTLRTPGYPIFILLTGGLINPWFTIIAQQVISVLGAYWLYQWLKQWNIKQQTTLLIAILFALDIPSFIFNSYLLADGLFQTLIVGVCYFLIGKKTPSTSAILLVIACYVKPAALFFIPIWALYLLYTKPHYKSVAIIAISLCLVFCWNYRNHQHHQRFIFSTAGEFNWCSWHGANIIAQQNNIPITQAQYVWWDSLATNYPTIPENNPVAYSQYISQQSTNLIFSNLDLLTKQTIQGVAMLWLKPTRSHIDQQWEIQPTKKGTGWLSKLQSTSWLGLLLMFLQVISMILLYPLAIYGYFVLLKKHKLLAIFIGVTLLYFSCMILPPTTYARLRLPIIPLIYFLAALGLPTFIPALKNTKWLTQKV